jgi:hypothetical protein
MLMIGFFVIIIALVGAAIGGSPKPTEDAGKDIDDFRNWPLKPSEMRHLNGHLNENSDETIIMNVTEKYVTSVLIELNWLDEADATGPGDYENQPDSFNFTITTPWGTKISSDEVYNPLNQAGYISKNVTIPEEGVESSTALGEWKVTIHCGNCGNHQPRINFSGFREIEDNGNDWALSYKYEFHTNN